jgi:hypothetical protein
MADAHQKNHDYHIIAPSPWPILATPPKAIRNAPNEANIGHGLGAMM